MINLVGVVFYKTTFFNFCVVGLFHNHMEYIVFVLIPLSQLI